MAELTKAELTEFEKRLRAVEAIADTSKGALNTAKFLLAPLWPTLLIIAAWLFNSIGDLKSSIGDLKTSLSEINGAIRVNAEKTNTSNATLEGKIENLKTRMQNLENRVQILGAKGANLSNLKVFHGWLQSAKGNEIQLMSLTDKTMQSFTIGKDALILIDGAEGAVEDLYGLKAAQAYVYFLTDERRVAKIEIEKRK